MPFILIENHVTFYILQSMRIGTSVAQSNFSGPESTQNRQYNVCILSVSTRDVCMYSLLRASKDHFRKALGQKAKPIIGYET